ncbi:H-NS histone family protein [Pseudaestuariivita sp.]|uniref:H-NS histone family protein n=1 Tax=Pseudaestuariivita sp. TaxID=2211669 RepID=UPI004059F917
MNLDAMSKEELLDLRNQVDKALKSVDARKKTEALKAAEEAARAHGFSLDQLTKGKGGATSAPKFRNPDNPNQTWTGRGRKPGWFTQAIDGGASESDLAI